MTSLLSRLSASTVNRPADPATNCGDLPARPVRPATLHPDQCGRLHGRDFNLYQAFPEDVPADPRLCAASRTWC